VQVHFSDRTRRIPLCGCPPRPRPEMPAPTARQLKQRAEEARVIGEQMRDLGPSYERGAKHAAMREENIAIPEDDQNGAA